MSSDELLKRLRYVEASVERLSAINNQLLELLGSLAEVDRLQSEAIEQLRAATALQLELLGTDSFGGSN